MTSYASFFTGAPDAEAGSEPQAPAQQYRLLLVDDEPNVLKALQRVFRQENYLVATAPNPGEALKLMSQGEFHLVISDYMMPGMTGAEFLKQVKSLYPETIRIMLTGHADTGAVMGAVNEGAVYKFILKPWNDDDLRITVALALEQFDLIRKNRILQQDNSKKTKEISALSKLSVSNRSQLAIMLNKHGLLNSNQVQELHRL
ncbi:MAG: response regulator, partial [Sulfurimicrobium sp.]|nr:response regulator [Sulfurimicrobium sp.]